MKTTALALCLAFASGCGGAPEAAESKPEIEEAEETTPSLSVPETLARLDGVQDTSPYNRALGGLFPLCNERGYDLADIVVVTRDVLARSGTEVSLLEILVGIRQSVPPEAAPMDCDEIAAAWATLRMG